MVTKKLHGFTSKSLLRLLDWKHIESVEIRCYMLRLGLILGNLNYVSL